MFFSCFSVFLDDVKSAFQRDSNITYLLTDSYFSEVLSQYQSAWRKVVASAVHAGVPVPAFSSALSFYDSFRCDRLPANMIQVVSFYLLNITLA